MVRLGIPSNLGNMDWEGRADQTKLLKVYGALVAETMRKQA